MCGHVYHEFCIENEGIRRCNKHREEFEEKIQKKAQFMEQAHNTQQFYNDLSKKTGSKFTTIAEYFGRGLFADLASHR